MYAKTVALVIAAWLTLLVARVLAGIVLNLRGILPPALAAVTLALIGFFSFLMVRMTTPQMVPLFTDLSMDDSASIIKDLDRQGVTYEIKNDGYDPDKVSGGGRPETPDQNDIPALLHVWAEYKASKFTQPPGEEAGTILKPGSPEPKYWWADFERIVDSDANLTASRYKPTVGEEISDEDPAELIREVLGLEKQLVDGLETLLGEVGPV